MGNLIDFFSNALLGLNSMIGNMGWVIILFTLLMRSLLLPLTLPSLKARKKITKIKPELDKLKKKYGKDKQAFAQAQLKLYKKYNVNPIAGCLPQLLQIFVLIILYRALIQFLNQPIVDGVVINTQFLWFDLVKPDNKFILPVLAGFSQLVLSLMISPGAEIRDIESNKAKSKKAKKKNEQEEDTAEMAASMQQQMLFIMPIMTGFIAAKFPAGLALYWVISTVYSIAQQLLLSGPGGLTSYAKRLKLLAKK